MPATPPSLLGPTRKRARAGATGSATRPPPPATGARTYVLFRPKALAQKGL